MRFTSNKGFTLIEVVVALGVLSMGVISLFLMNSMVVRGNAGANTVSESTTWASDRLEKLVSMPYDSHNNGIDDDGDGAIDIADPSEDFTDGPGTNNGVGGLGDVPAKRATDPDRVADHLIVSADGLYTVYWNVAEQYPDPNMKTISVIVRNKNMDSDLTFTTVKIAP